MEAVIQRLLTKQPVKYLPSKRPRWHLCQFHAVNTEQASASARKPSPLTLSYLTLREATIFTVADAEVKR